jgi:hypothetical protein
LGPVRNPTAVKAGVNWIDHPQLERAIAPCHPHDEKNQPRSQPQSTPGMYLVTTLREMKRKIVSERDFCKGPADT